MKLRSDDDIYRARLIYLGPPGFTLPIQLHYAQWGLFAVICAVLTFLGWLAFGTLTVIGTAIGLSMFATSYIWGHVDPDRPVRKVLKTAATDWRATTRSGPGRLPGLRAGHVRVGRTR